MKKRITSMLIVFIFAAGSILGMLPFQKVEEANALSSSTEVRGIWVAYVDYSSLGLKTDSESTFRAKASNYLAKAKANHINTVYFHVRAFDDAAWKSKTFKPSKYLTSKSSFSYDPLKIMVELAHKKGLELHAWMNPYRINADYYLDPAKSETTSRIKKAVGEVMAYGVDGIHFDDYFYHAKKGYKDVNGKVTIKAGQAPSASKKRTNVNKMVKTIYSYVKEKNKKAKFGISPQGNIENCMNAGADVKTWLSSSGYIDYITPQIYWTNQWGSKGNVSMFTNRLKAWKGLKKNSAAMYIGLALYRTGIKAGDDPGWSKKSSNLASQLNLLRSNGCKGYVLFSGKDLYRKGAKTELKKFNRIVKRIPTVNAFYVDYKSVKLKWSKISDVKGYAVYRAGSKSGTYKKIKTITGSAATSYQDTGLTPGKKYYYKVKSYRTVSGTKKYSNSSAAVAKTAQPRAPKPKSTAGKKSVRLNWNKVKNVSGYTIYRATKKSGTYKKIKTVQGAASVTYTDEGLKKGTRYYYKLRAYKTVNEKRIYSNYGPYTTKVAK